MEDGICIQACIKINLRYDKFVVKRLTFGHNVTFWVNN